MKPEAPQLGTCDFTEESRSRPHLQDICCKNPRPVAAQPEPEAARCPTCESAIKGKRLYINGQPRDGKWMCLDSWHAAAPSESVAPPKQTDDAMIQSSCPDKQIIWFHGTTRIAALVVEQEGFKEGTWFAAHMEDALEFGGPIVFSVKVTFPPERAYAWQVCCINAIPASAIIKRTELFTVVGGIVAQTPVAQPIEHLIEETLVRIGQRVLKELPKNQGFIFRANLIRDDLRRLVARLTAENQQLTRELASKHRSR